MAATADLAASLYAVSTRVLLLLVLFCQNSDSLFLFPRKTRGVAPCSVERPVLSLSREAELPGAQTGGRVQEQLHNENGAQHLSQSHLYCWRTLAVTLELFPSMYRKCMFQLALVPAGTLMSQQLLTVRPRLAGTADPPQ